MTIKKNFATLRNRAACVFMMLAALQVFIPVQSKTLSQQARPVGDLAQEQIPTLNPDERATRPIKGGTSQPFQFSLLAGQYASLTVEQTGAILIATLIDPNDQEVIEMDSPGGAYSPIHLSMISVISGRYELKVKSVNSWARDSNCSVTLSVRYPTTTDRSFVEAQSIFALGRKSFRSEKPENAIHAYNRSLSYWQSTQDYRWQALTQYSLSSTYEVLGKRKQMEESLDETLRILEIQMAPRDWRLKASALNDLGTIYASTGRSEKAFEVLNQALRLYAAKDDQRGQASALGNLANAHGRMGYLSLARTFAERALSLREAENDKPGVSNLTNNLGAISDRLGEPDKALEYFRKALQNWEAVGEHRPADRARVATVLSNLATASDKLGKWNEAMDYYDRALEKFNASDPRRATTLDNKGELYAALGDLPKAKECYEQGLKILDDSGKPDVDAKAALMMHMGQLKVTLGEIYNAIKLFEEALSLQPHIFRQADIRTNLAAAYVQKNDLKQALEIYDRILELQVGRRDQQRGQALTLQKRGEAYVSLGRTDEALNDLRSALPLWRAVKDQRGEASTLNAIARVEHASGNLPSALANNAEAIRIVESLRTKISSYQLRTSYFAIQENYYELDADLKMQLSRIERRSEHLAAALESSEKARARVLLESLNEAGVGRSTNSDNSDPRFSSMIEEKLKLLSTLAAKAQVRTKFLNGPHSPEQIAILDRELTELNAKYEEIETKIRSRNPKFATLTKPTPASLAQIQQQLDDETLLIEFLLGEQRSYAWVVGTNSIEGIELPARREIEDLSNRVAKALSERGRIVKKETEGRRQERVKTAESDYGEASSLLSKAVLAPIAHLLTKKRLVIVADGALQLLPFEALPYPDQLKSAGGRSAQAVIDKHEIVTLPSASVLVLQRRELADRKPAPNVLAVIADPVFGENDPRVIAIQRGKKAAGDNDKTPPVSSARSNKASHLSRALGDVGIESVSEIRRLPFTLREAKAILRTVPAGQSFIALDFKANRDTVMNPQLSRYRIVHLATHGLVDLKQPELSGVLLSMVDKDGKEQNGYLSLNEIYNLNWPADLVVLSACETGIGKEIKGEGLIALTRGFMYAGAERVVASLWKVNDRATAELMAEFYQQMLVNRATPAAALRAAQLKLSHHPKWQNPHFWAGFVLQGEWR